MIDNFNCRHKLNSKSKLTLCKKTSGFTLIEIMIALAVLGIIVAVAIPAYDTQKLKGYRSDAVVLLTTAVQMQERLRTESGAYTNVQTDLTPTSITTSPKGKYNLTITNYSSETYTLVATATGTQLDDTNCRTFRISHTGVKTAEDDGANANTKCWPR